MAEKIVCNNAQFINYDSINGIIETKYPQSILPVIANFYSKMKLLKNGFYHDELSPPRKPRTTGKNSQNHRINGFIQQICVETGNDFETVKMYCKETAVARGYPYDDFQGRIIPWSESRIDTIQAGILIDTIEQLAAELNIILKED